MDLSDLRSDPVEAGGDSLTATLAARAGGGGRAVEYDDLTAATGLAFHGGAGRPDGAAPGGEWAGRDWNLLAAARRFGIELRPLHPPGAARGLRDAPEFEKHFADSYAPLIRQALDHGQAVLAWQGWPAPQTWQWGVVTREVTGGLGFAGSTPGGGGEVTLIEPIVQTYVVESLAGDVEPLRTLTQAALEAADRVVHDRLAPEFGVVTGHAAYDAWRQWPLDEEESVRRLAAAVGGVAHARSSAARFINRAGASAPSDLAAALHRVEAVLPPVIESASTLCRVALNESGDAQRLRDGLTQLQETERSLAEAVRSTMTT